ncbi:MAG: guanylate kinase [Dehalococcoidia bacterium]|nr:guanylate kinase [Dehalococcoidia bacterium]
MLIVLSGPSGVGKDAVLARMKRLGRPFGRQVEPSLRLHYAVTVTTRPQRKGEIDGVDYHFVSPESFQEMVKSGQLLEWAEVYGNLYGVPRQEVNEALKEGHDVIVKADVQGAATIKGIMPQALLIFLAPPSMEELAARLNQRKSESTIDLKRRIETSHEEMKQLPLFDYVVVNHQDRVDLAVAQIEAITTAEKCRVTPRVID